MATTADLALTGLDKLDPLPPLVQALRTQLYPPIARVANTWAERLDERTYPDTLDGLLAECAAEGQTRPTPLVLRYGPGGHNNLHQDVYGDLTFPLQFLVMLSEPDVDFTGGESVFVEQRPRQQSRPMVARPGPGQAVIFTVHDTPVGPLALAASDRGLTRISYRDIRHVPAAGDPVGPNARAWLDLAARLGLVDDGPRRVGVAMARNPVAIVVPCHRVLGAGGALTGYGGGLAAKQTLLDLEARDRPGQLTIAI